jgi:hypothetical protein
LSIDRPLYMCYLDVILKCPKDTRRIKMTEKTETYIALGEPENETGSRPIIAKVGAFVPLSPEEIKGYACLRHLKDAERIEAVILYDSQRNPVMTPFVIVYPKKGESYLLDTEINTPLVEGEENAARVAIAYLQFQEESIIKAAKEYIRCRQTAENSLETLRRALK